eukprot:scaffold289150_cov21-Tisochrysis_lutea.AAC.1
MHQYAEVALLRSDTSRSNITCDVEVGQLTLCIRGEYKASQAPVQVPEWISVSGKCICSEGKQTWKA